MKKNHIFLLLCFLSFFTETLYSQNNTILSDELPQDEVQDLNNETLHQEDQNKQADTRNTSERQRMEMEIKTSTLPELAAWCRSLGLPESGTRADLSRQIRQHYGLSQPRPASTNQKVITIESAQISEYFKIDVVDEEYARLSGEVKLTLKESDTIHRISADEILFNKTRSLITARGGVEYFKETGDSIEIFRGENITVNIDDWSSIFLDGNTEYKLGSDGTSYLFEGTVISRTADEVTTLKNARITNAKNEEALWSITTSKLWLLPGSDFAFFNAVLKVGEIPLLYLPFFYFAADDLIFHPVIGYRSREGGFVQSTTYILGRPKINPSESSSITKILGNTNDMEKERQGMFLRNTGKKVVDPNALSLKALFDYYTNLGIYFAAELYVPKTGILDPLNFSAGFGFTRTVTQTTSGYTPYAPDYDGTFDWNKPFRYKIKLDSSISTQHARLAWDFPYYSDPYVDIDFDNRAESMDWFNMIQQGSSSADDSSLSNNEKGAYEWKVFGNINPSLPSLSPYISRISISNISTTLSFIPIEDNKILQHNKDDPGRHFYAPNVFSIYNFSGTVSGNPYSFGKKNIDSSAASVPKIDDPLNGIGQPVSPWPEEEDMAEKTISDEKLVPPLLTQRFELPSAGNIMFEIDYHLPVSTASELQFMSGYNNWQASNQVKLTDMESILASFSINRANLNFRMNYSNLFTNEFTFSGSGTWRNFTYLNEEANRFRVKPYDPFDPIINKIDDSKIETARQDQFRQTNYSTSYAYKGTLNPFYQNPVFGHSRFQYDFGGTLVNSKRYSNGNKPELSPQWGGWVKQDFSNGREILGLTSHKFTSYFAANFMDKQQDISISTDLPPLDTSFYTNATFRYWISETNINFRIKRQENANEEYEWIFEPVYFNETISFSNLNRFTYYMVLDPKENNEITNITSTLTLWGFGVSYKALKTFGFEFEEYNKANPSQGGIWKLGKESKLRSSELSFFYRHRFSNIDIVKNRLSFSLDLDSTLTYNLLKHTDSNFQFQMGFNFGITNFLDIRLSATSENNVVFRYFKGFPRMSEKTKMYTDGPQNNLFVDLFDSFNFFSEARRMRSGFKMKQFDLKAIHHLGDWTAEFGVTMYPYLNKTQIIPNYKVTADISFIVQWKPISEIKTNIEYKGEDDRWSKK